MSLDRIQDIVDNLAAHLGHAVAVNDFALDLIAASAQIGPVDQYRVESIMNRHTPQEVIELLRERALLPRSEPFMLEDNALPNMQARMCVPLVESGIPIAYLWVMIGTHQPDSGYIQLVRQAAAALVEELVAMRAPHDDELLLDSRRLQAVLSPDAFSGGYAFSSLVADGLVSDLQRATIAVFEFTDTHGAPPSEVQAYFRPIHRDARNSWARRALLGLTEGRLTAICSAADAEALIDQAQQALTTLNDSPVHFSSVGTSTSEQPSIGLRDTYDEARFAAKIASTVPAIGKAADYSDLGLFLALRQFALTEESVRQLSPAAAELRRRDSDVYAKTALTLLNCAGDVQATCDSLSIHRTTLYYRLERIRDFTGDVIDVGWQRSSLHLGLLMGELVDSSI